MQHVQLVVRIEAVWWWAVQLRMQHLQGVRAAAGLCVKQARDGAQVPANKSPPAGIAGTEPDKLHPQQRQGRRVGYSLPDGACTGRNCSHLQYEASKTRRLGPIQSGGMLPAHTGHHACVQLHVHACVQLPAHRQDKHIGWSAPPVKPFWSI